MIEDHDSDVVSEFWADFDSIWRDGGALSADEISLQLLRDRNYSLSASTVRGWLDHKRLPRKDDDFAEMCLLLAGKERANELMARLQAARRAVRARGTLPPPDSPPPPKEVNKLTAIWRQPYRSLRPWPAAAAVAGVVFGVLVVLALLPHDDASKTTSSAADKEKLHIKIPPSSYDVFNSSWKPYGPFYEAKSDLYARYGVTHAHAYGNSIGWFVYHVDIGSFQGARAELKARLSADAIGYSDPADKYSDVTLTINDTQFPIRRVMPDDARGAYYTWQFDAKLLRHGRNTIKFTVERNTQFPNGLCIYGGAIAPGYTDEWITLQTE